MTEIPQAEPVDAADTAFLFEEIGGSRRAISRDLLGARLPQSPQGWSVTQTFLLAVDHILPVDLQPEPVLRAVLEDGVYCWDVGEIPQPKGTGQ